MLKYSLANLRAYSKRYLICAITIAVGSFFIGGTLDFSATLRNTLVSNLAQSAKSADVFVDLPANLGFALRQNSLLLSNELFNKVKSLPSVDMAAGESVGEVGVLNPSLHPIESFGSVVALGTNSSNFNPYVKLIKGSLARGENQVALDSNLITLLNLHLGSLVHLENMFGNIKTFTLTGEVSANASPITFGEDIVNLDEAQMRSFVGINGYVEIALKAKAGISQEMLANQVATIVGSQGRVFTSNQKVQEDESKILAATRALSSALLAFGFVAMLISGFVIANTFRILSAQREKQLALLRLIGALKRQIAQLVIQEAIILALISSIVGVLLSPLLVIVAGTILDKLAKGFFLSKPVFSASIIIFPVVVAEVVSVISVIAPANAATKFAPIRAVSLQLETRQVLKIKSPRFLLGTILLVFGGLILYIGVKLYGSLDVTVLGGAIIYIGLLMLQPLIVPGFSMIFSFFAKTFNLGRLRIATLNLKRNPIRTSATSSALTIGISLIVLFACVFTSLSASISQFFTSKFPFDFVINPQSQFFPVPNSLVDKLSHDKNLSEIYPIREGVYQSDNKLITVSSFNPKLVPKLGITRVAGEITTLNQNQVLVSKSLANTLGVSINQPLLISRANSNSQIPLMVVGIYGASPFARGLLVSSANPEFSSDPIEIVGLQGKEGVSLVQVQRSLEPILNNYPALSLSSAATIKGEISSIAGKIIAIFDGLLGFSLIIAFFGITNTLSLAVIERTKEFGILRVLGMKRKELLLIMVEEGLLVGSLGALIGMAIGIVAAWGISFELRNQGLDVFSVPIESLVIYFLVSLIVSVLASLLPANTGSKIPPARALTFE